MTARAEYTAEEWGMLGATPILAQMAVVLADGSGLFETVFEAVRSSVVMYQGKARYPHNELIGALTQPQQENARTESLPQFQEVGETAEQAYARLRPAALKMCRDVMTLLAERTNPEEAAGYAAWVMDTARAAATSSAHREGLFAPKGPVVDRAEREVLAEIADALGTEVGELPADDAPAPNTVPGGSDFPSGPLDPS